MHAELQLMWICMDMEKIDLHLPIHPTTNHRPPSPDTKAVTDGQARTISDTGATMRGISKQTETRMSGWMVIYRRVFVAICGDYSRQYRESPRHGRRDGQRGYQQRRGTQGGGPRHPRGPRSSPPRHGRRQGEVCVVFLCASCIHRSEQH